LELRPLILRYVGAVIGVLVGEIGTYFPFATVYARAPAGAALNAATFVLYVLAVSLIFTAASKFFSMDNEFNLRSGVKLGFVYSLALGFTFVAILATFSTYEPLFLLGAFLTQLVNYTVAGALGGYLTEKFPS
jgi:hypothetical protein